MSPTAFDHERWIAISGRDAENLRATASKLFWFGLRSTMTRLAALKTRFREVDLTPISTALLRRVSLTSRPDVAIHLLPC
ncbi:MAG: hypothetical protein AAGJ79_01945 [Verrucomicrobiota bacterium]